MRILLCLDLNSLKKILKILDIYILYVDHNFITTHPSILKNKFKNQKFNFFFVPVDRNIECFNVYKSNPEKKIYFIAMSHGVNRGILKKESL